MLLATPTVMVDDETTTEYEVKSVAIDDSSETSELDVAPPESVTDVSGTVA